MSLRSRLTVFYTALVAGTVVLVGALAYGLVSVILFDLIDARLTATAERILGRLHFNIDQPFYAPLMVNNQPGDPSLLQVWSSDNKLLFANPPDFSEPLDANGQWAAELDIRSIRYQGRRLRVLSVPLVSAQGKEGLLHLAIDLTLLDLLHRALPSALALSILLSVIFFGVAAWFGTAYTLSPLTTLTRIAAKITSNGDLRNRIPARGGANDELGNLIHTFNQTLEKVEKLVSTQRRFLTDVSHELRTPLTVIKGIIGIQRRERVFDEDALASIELEIDRLTHMVGDLLLLGEVESAPAPLNFEPVELDTVLLEVFQAMRVLAGDRIQLRMAEIDQAQVNGDRNRLKQVFINLVSNAIQYTPPGGVVTLALRKTVGQVQVLVSDNGPGIPPEDLPHIFERFYRGEKSRNRRQGAGFGLGLSIAYYIVRSHGGAIEVTSKVGSGTTFCVCLPEQPHNPQ